MDWNFMLLIFFWVVNNALMYRIGYTRAFKDAAGVIVEEVLKTKAPEHVDNSGDAAYWRKMYEEEVNAPGETTE